MRCFLAAWTFEFPWRPTVTWANCVPIPSRKATSKRSMKSTSSIAVNSDLISKCYWFFRRNLVCTCTKTNTRWLIYFYFQQLQMMWLTFFNWIEWCPETTQFAFFIAWHDCKQNDSNIFCRIPQCKSHYVPKSYGIRFQCWLKCLFMLWYVLHDDIIYFYAHISFDSKVSTCDICDYWMAQRF